MKQLSLYITIKLKGGGLLGYPLDKPLSILFKNALDNETGSGTAQGEGKDGQLNDPQPGLPNLSLGVAHQTTSERRPNE